MSDTQPSPDKQAMPEADQTENPKPNDTDHLTSLMSPEQALEKLVQNPVAFVQDIVNSAAQTHLADLREEAELRGALSTFRNAYPEFTRFEPFIIQEAVSLIENDPDGSIAPWPDILDKAMKRFQQKFQDTIKTAQAPVGEKPSQTAPYLEAAAKRSVPEQPQTFTRDQLSKMSLNDFLKNEAAINAALENKRIR